MALALIFLLLISFPSAAVAWNEPDSFVGIKWGTTPEEGLVALRERSLDAARTPPQCTSGTYAGGSRQTNCKATLKLGTALLWGDFRFNDAGFAWAFGTFPSRDYETLKLMFVEKYGEPTATRHRDVTTRGGARLDDESLEWVGDNVVLRLSRFTGKVTEGGFEASTKAEDDKRTERSKALLKKGKEGL